MKRKYQINITAKGILQTFLVITFLGVAWAPATGNSTLSGEGFKTAMRVVYFLLPMCLLLLTLWSGKLNLHRSIIVIAVTTLFHYLVQRLFVYSEPAGSLSTLLICLIFLLQTEEIKGNFFYITRYIMIFLSAISIICYLSYMIDLGIPYTIEPYYATSKSGVYYANYSISFLYVSSFQIRACGIFNEPGWFGTFLAFYLCADCLNARKIGNVIMILAGTLTFSLAFVLIIFLFFIITHLDNWKHYIWIVILLLAYICILPNVQTGNEAIDLFVDRIVLDESFFTENKRTIDTFDQAFDNAIRNGKIWSGFGSGYSDSLGGGTLSIKTDILDYGVLLTSAFYIPIFVSLLIAGKGRLYPTAFSICFFISLYQRPWLYEASNYMLLFGEMAYLNMKEKQRTIILLNKHQ